MSEGLEYKMKEEIHTAEDFTSFLRQIKSKRYTYARLRRLCLYTLLNVTEKEIKDSYKDVSILLLLTYLFYRISPSHFPFQQKKPRPKRDEASRYHPSLN